MGKERDGNGREGAEGKKRVEKGEGKLDLDICPGPEFLVTPLDETKCCFKVQSKADMSQLNLPHGTYN